MEAEFNKFGDGATKDKQVVMFEDEARFGRMSDPARCWAPDGQRPSVSSQIVREYTYAFGAVNPRTGEMHALILPDADTEGMNIFLSSLSAAHPDKYIVMVADKAGWHISNGLVVPSNIRISHLPPYSPELNPAEHLWDHLREKYFKNRHWDSMEGVENELEKGLKEMIASCGAIKSLTGFEWIVNN